MSASALEKWLEYDTYTQLGWRGVLFAVLVGSLIFGIFKHHVGFRNIGPNEGGIREFFGIKLWKLRPGPHFYITGFSNVRKAPLAVGQIDLVGEVRRGELIYRYEVAVQIHVINTRAALIARIYFAEDNDKTDMDNAENVKQITTVLKRSLRKLLETEATANEIEKGMKKARRRRLEEKYGSKVFDVLVTELVPRPHSELSAAIRQLPLPPEKVAAVLGAEEALVEGHPHLEALPGGVGAS
jgi:hypothetical protein